MGKVYLLDCTLRDGGYVNDWNFGRDAIKDIFQKIAQTGIELLEVGFLKGEVYNPDKTLFPDTFSISSVIQPKSKRMRYVAMVDMSAPISLDKIAPYDGTSIDGIRVIFKKNKIDQAYEYCDEIQKKGYFVSVNFVSTDQYTDEEFTKAIERFNQLSPYAMSIVDTFGLLKKKRFLQLVRIADEKMKKGTVLAYHAHNNLQQAMGNAESLVELNLDRELIIDACIFGMGRGAGNLNLELFAEYMNENYGTTYKIEPMLGIMDEYLNEIYNSLFWGYSLPLYVSATLGVHPNYAIYLAKKDSLTLKAFSEVLKSLSDEEKVVFSREVAENGYRKYMENYVDDKNIVKEFSEMLQGKKAVLLSPGKNLMEYKEEVLEFVRSDNCVVFATNFLAKDFRPDYVFSSNMRRFSKMDGNTDSKCIITSNMKEAKQKDYVINFASYTSDNPEIIDNSGLMLMRFLMSAGVKDVYVAGMDGYSSFTDKVYYDSELEYVFSPIASNRNYAISKELSDINKHMNIHFLTPTEYKI